MTGRVGGIGQRGIPRAGRETGKGLNEIAERFGITPQRVQQIEKAALRKLRKAAEARGISLEDALREAWR